MKKCMVIMMAVLFFCGCATSGYKFWGKKNTKTLTIKWQRLVDKEGRTCERCGSTEKEIKQAVKSLNKSLGSLGIDVVLEEKALTPEECAKDISRSNQIMVGKRALEKWIGGKVGKSLCGSVCAGLGKNMQCRTITVGGKTYETIPSELIIKAGLMAGAQAIETPAVKACPLPSKAGSGGCCPSKTSNQTCK